MIHGGVGGHGRFSCSDSDSSNSSGFISVITKLYLVASLVLLVIQEQQQLTLCNSFQLQPKSAVAAATVSSSSSGNSSNNDNAGCILSLLGCIKNKFVIIKGDKAASGGSGGGASAVTSSTSDNNKNNNGSGILSSSSSSSLSVFDGIKNKNWIKDKTTVSITISPPSFPSSSTALSMKKSESTEDSSGFEKGGSGEEGTAITPKKNGGFDVVKNFVGSGAGIATLLGMILLCVAFLFVL